MTIESFAAHHARAIVHVIGSVFAEYGMTFDPADYDSDLLDIEQYYAGHGGWFSVLTDGGRVVGTVAAVPREGSTWELKRLYLLAEYRGQGRGRALIEHALSRLHEAGCRDVVAWSDTRLETAHEVYLRLGFEPIGERTLEDIDKSLELGFRKTLG